MQQDLYWLDADAIREKFLRRHDWKQQRLAKGLSLRTVANVLNNERPVSFETATVLAATLEVRLVDLHPRLAQAPALAIRAGVEWEEMAPREEGLGTGHRHRHAGLS